jgi:hypothetical protein
MIRGIDHLAISTPDIDRLSAFYRNQLGFQVVFTQQWTAGNSKADLIIGLRDSQARVVMLKLGNVSLELCSHGMIFYWPPQTVGGGSMRATYGRDPDGNIIELLERIPVPTQIAEMGPHSATTCRRQLA